MGERDLAVLNAAKDWWHYSIVTDLDPSEIDAARYPDVLIQSALIRSARRALSEAEARLAGLYVEVLLEAGEITPEMAGTGPCR